MGTFEYIKADNRNWKILDRRDSVATMTSTVHLLSDDGEHITVYAHGEAADSKELFTEFFVNHLRESMRAKK